MENVVTITPAIDIDRYRIYTRSVIKAAQVAAELNENPRPGKSGECLGIQWEFLAIAQQILAAMKARKGKYPVETECDFCNQPILTSEAQLDRAEAERKIILCSRCWEKQ